MSITEGTMLLISRNIGEGIVIMTPAGDNITVRVLAITGVQAKIGIEAPRHVQIVRPDAKKQSRT